MKNHQTALDGNVWFRICSFIVYYMVVVPALFLVCFGVYGLRSRRLHVLRSCRKAILAMNHCQYIEPGIQAVSVWPRKILFTADEYNVTRKGGVGVFIRLLRAIGIPDENPLSMAGTLERALKSGWLVNVYPEGVLNWRFQEPGPFRDGFFFFANLFDVPVIPVAEVLHDRPVRKLFPWWPPRTEIVYCDPVYPATFRGAGRSRRDCIRLISEEVRRRIVDTIRERGGCTNLPERRIHPSRVQEPVTDQEPGGTSR